MAAGGRGAFRNETRATRLERLHVPQQQTAEAVTQSAYTHRSRLPDHQEHTRQDQAQC